MKHEILIAPHAALREVAQPVEEINDDVLTLLDDMVETMHAAPGIGLAATQIGIPQRLVVMDMTAGQGKEPGIIYKMINPKVVEASEEPSTLEEGCLSLPGQYADVTRPAQVKAEYTDINGETQTIEAQGLLAACIQHEIDHLDGKLFIDYLSSLKRDFIMKALKKEMRLREKGQ